MKGNLYGALINAILSIGFSQILLIILQADPIDGDSTPYQAGSYLAYVFVLVFVVAIIFAVRKMVDQKVSSPGRVG
jgi:ABC-type uncharacterized transport system permease subunit